MVLTRPSPRARVVAVVVGSLERLSVPWGMAQRIGSRVTGSTTTMTTATMRRGDDNDDAILEGVNCCGRLRCLSVNRSRRSRPLPVTAVTIVAARRHQPLSAVAVLLSIVS